MPNSKTEAQSKVVFPDAVMCRLANIMTKQMIEVVILLMVATNTDQAMLEVQKRRSLNPSVEKHFNTPFHVSDRPGDVEEYICACQYDVLSESPPNSLLATDTRGCDTKCLPDWTERLHPRTRPSRHLRLSICPDTYWY